MTHDWEQAIDIYLQLEQRGAVDGGPDQVAHYYCELAMQAKTSDDLGTAKDMLSKAIKRKPDSVRAQLMTADLLQEAGEHATVIPMYAPLDPHGSNDQYRSTHREWGDRQQIAARNPEQPGFESAHRG